MITKIELINSDWFVDFKPKSIYINNYQSSFMSCKENLKMSIIIYVILLCSAVIECYSVPCFCIVNKNWNK